MSPVRFQVTVVWLYMAISEIKPPQISKDSQKPNGINEPIMTVEEGTTLVLHPPPLPQSAEQT